MRSFASLRTTARVARGRLHKRTQTDSQAKPRVVLRLGEGSSLDPQITQTNPNYPSKSKSFVFFDSRKAIAKDRRAVSRGQSISMQKRRNKAIVTIEILRFAQDDRSDTPRARLHKRTQINAANPRVSFFRHVANVEPRGAAFRRSGLLST